MFIQASVQGYQVPVAADPNVTPDPRDRVSQECVREDTLLRERAKTRERERERESSPFLCDGGNRFQTIWMFASLD